MRVQVFSWSLARPAWAAASRCVRVRASETTTYDYRRKWELYCTAAIGNTLAAKLTKIQLVRLYADLQRSGGKDGAPLSGNTVTKVHGLIHAVLEWAVRLDMGVERNVAGLLSRDDLPTAEHREAESHQPAAIAHLLESTAGTRCFSLAALGIGAGLRRGEFAALKWDDIDQVACVAMVRGSYAVIPGRVWHKPTKSAKPRRVELPELAMRALKNQRKIQAMDKLKAGGRYQDDGYVFAPEKGGHYAPNSLYKIYAQGAKAAGVKLTKLHALRHSYATWLISSGVDIATVSKLLGHSAITTTLRVYAHTILGAEKAAVRNIDTMFSESEGYRRATAGGSDKKKPRG